MNDKQIFAAIEVTEDEVRLIVGEFFNTRFNILKVERVTVSGMSEGVLSDPEAITAAIQRAVGNAGKLIGAPIQKVLLSIPSYGMRRYSVKSTVPVKGIDCLVTVQDIRNAMKKAQTLEIDKELALIQTVCVKYTVNGISSRRIPLNEKCNELTVDIDLLCANRKLAFDLVGCVEKAGLTIMDIYMDIFAVGKEAALFEQAVDRRIVVLKVERASTTLGLFTKGRLTSCFVQQEGIGDFAGALVDKYGMKSDHAAELVMYSARLNEKVLSSNLVDIWENQGMRKTITEQELCECIQPKVDAWLEDMEKLCAPILQSGPTTVIITGDGGEMQGLNELLQRRLNTEVRNYIPETLGGRYGGLSSCLGLFYAYKDTLPIIGMSDSSLDLDAFEKAVSFRSNESSEKEDTITNKLKGFLFEGKK